MNYWLVKSEPSTYSWDDFVKLGRDHWDGVRNYAARNNMRSMAIGDLVLFYHSVKKPSVIGIAEVCSDYYQDPTTEDERWGCVDLKVVRKLKNIVPLKMVKADERLQNMALVRISRLSVQPVKKEEFDIIIAMSEREA